MRAPSRRRSSRAPPAAGGEATRGPVGARAGRAAAREGGGRLFFSW